MTYVDLIPHILGNDDIKSVLLWALCRYDFARPDQTVPVILIGKSGEGKTAIMRSIKATFDCRLYEKDGLTEPGLADLKMERRFICFDEISKWQLNNLGAVIKVFSHGTTERTRKASQKTVVANCLPVATLLDTWEASAEDMKGIESKKFIIAQMLRRGVMLHVQPTTSDPVVHRAYVDSVLCDIFQLDTEKDDAVERMRQRVLSVLERAWDLSRERTPYIDRADAKKVTEYILTFMNKIVIDKLVSYDEEFPKVLSQLSIGRALSLGRTKVTLGDYHAVGQLIKRHAWELKMWNGTESDLNLLEIPQAPASLPAVSPQSAPVQSPGAPAASPKPSDASAPAQ